MIGTSVRGKNDQEDHEVSCEDDTSGDSGGYTGSEEDNSTDRNNAEASES